MALSRGRGELGGGVTDFQKCIKKKKKKQEIFVRTLLSLRSFLERHEI